ncbi:hypothetical protein L2E82_48350 [Cichorium intybus]|uniref:Uncharacterized protein n=1 Tax=Cichorium intybus TaxID=13427 RepID=A0ACB8YY77_CICIN|nr:hypothetical protein L2E82_48350 [Cichorium intybus]
MSILNDSIFILRWYEYDLHDFRLQEHGDGGNGIGRWPLVEVMLKTLKFILLLLELELSLKVTKGKKDNKKDLASYNKNQVEEIVWNVLLAQQET